MVSTKCLAALAVLSACCCLATPLPAALPAEAESFRVDVLDVHHLDDTNVGDVAIEGDGNEVDDLEDPPGDEKQLSPATQSFLSTLGTALGPIVGAIVGPLLTNIGQNLSAGSGAQAIAQLQQAAAAVVAQQQAQAGVAVAADASIAPPSSPSSSSRPEVSVTPPPPAQRPARPTRPGRPASRPGRPASRPSPVLTTTTPTTTTTSTTSKPPRQTFDAFVLDVPGRGPFLFLMTPNATAAEQSAAIQQAQQQAAQLLAVNGQASPIGAVASLIGSTTPTPWPQVTKPTSVGPLPVRPFGVTPTPLPSYHSLLEIEDQEDHEDQQQGEEEVAVTGSESEDHIDVKHDSSRESGAKDDDYSAQSFLERLFPEMI